MMPFDSTIAILAAAAVFIFGLVGFYLVEKGGAT